MPAEMLITAYTTRQSHCYHQHHHSSSDFTPARTRKMENQMEREFCPSGYSGEYAGPRSRILTLLEVEEAYEQTRLLQASKP